MTRLTYSVLALALGATVASAQVPSQPVKSIIDAQSVQILRIHHEDSDAAPAPQLLASLPGEAWTITDWYKQSVYDRSNNKIGEIMDVLVDHEGKNVAAIIGVGGFLGMGEKDVAVPFDAVRFKKQDNNTWHAMLNTTKDALRDAPGYKFDRTARKWMPANAPVTTGGPALR